MKALDELEEIKELVNADKKFKYKSIVNFNCESIEKSLKALDIIKKKKVACDLLTNPDVTDYKKYNSHCDKYDFIVPLTEEEFNLLKEVLE